MPQSVNGFGTTIYKGRGDVGFGGADSVIWVVALYIPLIPLSCFHGFNWSGNQYQSVPLRWSWVLVWRSFLFGWRGVLLVFGIIAVVTAVLAYALGPEKHAAEASHKNTFLIVMGVAASVMLPLAALTHLLFLTTDRRTDDIRRVLGPHSLGSADPALLTNPYPPNPQETYGHTSFLVAAEKLLEQGQFVKAMWAARFTVAVEDAAVGEELTDRILHHPDVIEALVQVRRKPGCWPEAMRFASDKEH